jgi:hypothetical protein
MSLFHADDVGQKIRSLKMPPGSVSAVFGTFNGERIVSPTAILPGHYARALPLHGDARPQVLSRSWVVLFPVGTDGMYDEMAGCVNAAYWIRKWGKKFIQTGAQTFCQKGMPFDEFLAHA